MEKMEIYNAVRAVPNEAKKTISAGRLKGMTDINPMWRINILTDIFGPCGIGWKYVIKDKRFEPGANGEIAAFVDIDLFFRTEDGWSEAIPGTGGAAFIAKERNGLYTSDECLKMATTDALSVACKALGVGADVYWAAGRTKYSDQKDPPPPDPPKPDSKKPGYLVPPKSDPPVVCAWCNKRIPDYFDGKYLIKAAVIAKRNKERFGQPVCDGCGKKAAQ